MNTATSWSLLDQINIYYILHCITLQANIWVKVYKNFNFKQKFSSFRYSKEQNSSEISKGAEQLSSNAFGNSSDFSGIWTGAGGENKQLHWRSTAFAQGCSLSD